MNAPYVYVSFPIQIENFLVHNIHKWNIYKKFVATGFLYIDIDK